MIDNLFLSVGAMKAGTTWLYSLLRNHPEIYFTPEKEIHYFANKVGIDDHFLTQHSRLSLLKKKCINRVANGNIKYLSQHISELKWYTHFAEPKDITNEWYESLFQFKGNEKWCADFSNLYCRMDKEGWDNVRKVAKNIRVIYILRDPFTRAWSHYKFHMKFVNREDEAIASGFKNFKFLMEEPWLWDNGEYVKNYHLLKENLAEEEFMLLYFEDLLAEPEKYIQKIQGFLGIEGLEIPKGVSNNKVNKTKGFSMPNEWRVYLEKRIMPVEKELKDAGLWHSSWASCLADK